MSEFIAEAQVLITPNTAAFAATLRKQLEVAVAAAGPVIVPIQAGVAATGAGKALAVENAAATVAAKEHTAAVGRQTAALEVEGAVAERTAISQSVLAAAEKKSALSHQQATRAIEAQAASLAGLRGAVLTASTPFLVATVAAVGFAKAIGEASDTTEELNKATVVFGQNSDQIKEFATTTAESLGISEVEALKATGVFGNLFRTIKISTPVAADMSEKLVRIAADLASFNNADPSRVLEALRSGLVGQARPLRVFGIFISQARAQQEALIDTGKQNIKELTNAELVQARYNIILRDSNIASGDFANTSDRLANQTRILRASISDLGASLGAILLPGLTAAVGAANEYVQVFIKADHATTSFAHHIPLLGAAAEKSHTSLGSLAVDAAKLYGRMVVLGPVIGAASLAIDRFGSSADKATGKMSGFQFALGGLKAEIAAMKAVQNAVDFSGIIDQLNALEVAQLKIQTGLTPGGRGAEESNLQQQIATHKKAVEAAKSGTKARKDALEQLKADQDALQSLQDQAISEQKAAQQRAEEAARKAKEAAKKAQTARDDQFKALADAFGSRQQKIIDAAARAGIADNLDAQIRLNKELQAALAREKRVLLERLRSLKVSADTRKSVLQAINKSIEDAQQEELTLAKQQAENRKKRQQDLLDAQRTHLEALLSIAETTKSKSDDVAREKALIALDNLQIRRILAIKRRRKLTLDEAAQLDALRVDVAQRNKAIKDLKGEQEKGQNEAAQFFFSQLQAQQGFVGNLLGNLITGSTAGLVGVPSPTGAAGGPIEDRLARTRTGEKAKTTPGPTAGQHQTTNDILIRILHALTRQNRTDQAPEAHHNRRVGAAIMDNDGIHGI